MDDYPTEAMADMLANLRFCLSYRRNIIEPIDDILLHLRHEYGANPQKFEEVKRDLLNICKKKKDEDYTLHAYIFVVLIDEIKDLFDKIENEEPKVKEGS